MSEGELSSDSVDLNDGAAFDINNGSPASSNNDVDMPYDRDLAGKDIVNGYTSKYTSQPIKICLQNLLGLMMLW